MGVVMAKNLSHETAVVVLDIVEMFMEDFKASLRELLGQNDLMEFVFQVLISLLGSHISVKATGLLFQTLTSMVNGVCACLCVRITCDWVYSWKFNDAIHRATHYT